MSDVVSPNCRFFRFLTKIVLSGVILRSGRLRTNCMLNVVSLDESKAVIKSEIRMAAEDALQISFINLLSHMTVCPPSLKYRLH